MERHPRSLSSVLAALVLAAVLAAVLHAQPTGFPAASATVGVPFTFDFGQGLRDIVFPSVPGISFTYSYTLAGGSLPPGLSLKSDGLLSGTPTTPGQYNFTVNWTYAISAEGFSTGNTIPIPYGISVQGGTGPQVAVQPRGLSFAAVIGAPASSQYINVSNLGNQARTFSATASVNSGGSWLTVSTTGSAAAFSQGSVLVTATPGQLPTGTYVGIVSIVFAPGSERFDVPVILSITSTQQSIGLSQSGLTFRTVAGGGAPPAQSFSVLNVGVGALNWTASTSTLSGGAAWLSATPTAGRSDAATAPVVTVQVRPAGLAAGNYYGQVLISSPDIVNSPQAVSVVLTVLAANVNPGPVVQPTGLIFVGQAGGANPAPQNIDITNLTSTPATYTTAAFFDQGTNWFSAPKSGTATLATPGRLAVQANTTGLAAGAYLGEMDIRIAEDNSTRRVAILLVVTPRAGSAALKQTVAIRQADGCTPTKLLPIFTQLGSSFTTTAAWPTSLELRVVDDCGTPMTSGSVIASFSSGDPAVSLTSLRDGRWTGTWQPRAVPSNPVTITGSAQLVAPPIKGSASIGGTLQPNASTPVIAAGGAVNAISLAPLSPLAPGGLIVITGSNLADGSTLASDLPLKTAINGTQVLLAGRPMPLQFASAGQINAIVPYDVPVNTTHQMIVQRATSYSVPEPVNIAMAQPAVFTADGSGKGPALLSATHPDGTPFTVSADTPVTEGDTILISCAGLGPVDPPVDAAAAAPDSPPSQTTNVVMVTIGGQPATVVSAVLAPGATGLYQVTATVPPGITPAPDAPLVVTVADQPSPAVTVAVQ